MEENLSHDWNKESVRELRLRLGWSKSDLARRLKCQITQIDAWEDGSSDVEAQAQGELEIMYRQCLTCSDEVKYAPASEAVLDKSALEQIDFSRVKEDFE